MNNADGIAQLECYVDAYNNDKQNSVTYGADQAVVGNSYDSSFNGVAIPSVLHPGEYIVYRTYGDGLIIYNYQKRFLMIVKSILLVMNKCSRQQGKELVN